MIKCPECNERLVFVAMAIGGKVFKTWQCDCQYRNENDELIPPHIVGDIMRAREWDDGSMAYDLESIEQ